MVTTYWSIFSLIFYVFLAFVGFWCMYYIKKDSTLYDIRNFIRNRYVWLWIIVWTFFATFRLVAWGIGGADAFAYVGFFESCNNSTYSPWMEHVGSDLLFKWINKVLRFFTSDYHYYFAIIYAFMIFASIWSAKTFSKPNNSLAPYILVFFLYYRSFNTIRSNLAIAFILIALTLLVNKQNKSALFCAILSALVHKSSLLFAMVVPFCIFFSKRNIELKHLVMMIVGVSFVGVIVRNWFIDFSQEVDLNGSYGSYARRSVDANFFDDAWKIAFEQIILALFLFLNKKRILSENSFHINHSGNMTYILYLVCIFDFLLVPINFLLNIWRGYEYFYIPRIAMWGLIISLYKSKFNKSYIDLLYLFVFLGWMVFRIQRTYEMSRLMPYIFEPFINLL